MGNAVSAWAMKSFDVDWLETGITWIGFFFSALIAAIFAWPISEIMRPIGNRTWLASKRAHYQEVAYRIWNARYCNKDDVMFDTSFAGSPEDFRTQAFQSDF